MRMIIEEKRRAKLKPLERLFRERNVSREKRLAKPSLVVTSDVIDVLSDMTAEYALPPPVADPTPRTQMTMLSNGWFSQPLDGETIRVEHNGPTRRLFDALGGGMLSDTTVDYEIREPKIHPEPAVDTEHPEPAVETEWDWLPGPNPIYGARDGAATPRVEPAGKGAIHWAVKRFRNLTGLQNKVAACKMYSDYVEFPDFPESEAEWRNRTGYDNGDLAIVDYEVDADFDAEVCGAATREEIKVQPTQRVMENLLAIVSVRRHLRLK
jgi:hypothetical protein